MSKTYMDSYFPHEASTSDDSRIIQLIEDSGIKGYGCYWILIEHLRLQKDYIGSLRTLNYLARKCRTTPKFMLTVINDYGLFKVEGEHFFSPSLTTLMQPLDNKRRAISEKKRDESNYKNLIINKNTDFNTEQMHPYISKAEQSKAEHSNNTPSHPPKGEVCSFWNNFTPPSYARNAKTHNLKGMVEQLQRLHIEDYTQLQQILQLADYGRLGNPFWKLFYIRPIEAWKALKNPGISIIRMLKKNLIQKDINAE